MQNITPAAALAQTMKFELDLKRLAAQYLTSRIDADGRSQSILPLLAKLGCRCLCSEGRTWSNEEFEQPDVVHENLVKNTLLEALIFKFEYPVGNTWFDQFALLDGLARNERWKACLHTAENAHMFAALLLDGAQLVQKLQKHPAHDLLAQSLIPSVCEILNTWLIPEVPFEVYPPAGVIAQNMFGDAWYCTVLNSEFGIRLTPKEVIAMRPPFVQRLVMYEPDLGLVLPGMGLV